MCCHGVMPVDARVRRSARSDMLGTIHVYIHDTFICTNHTTSFSDIKSISCVNTGSQIELQTYRGIGWLIRIYFYNWNWTGIGHL